MLVEYDDTLIMIDCGLPLRLLEGRLAAVGRCVDDIDAVLITHEHGDHVRGVGPLRRRCKPEFWTTHGTARGVGDLDDSTRLGFDREFAIGAISVRAFPVPHDAREPCQFVFRGGDRKLGLLTDTGHATPVIRDSLANCDALAIEFNHDIDMLESGTYPETVKARVSSRFGHLSNDQAADMLANLAHPGLQSVMALHISERNNSPEKVRIAAARVTDQSGLRLELASQEDVSPWIEVA